MVDHAARSREGTGNLAARIDAALRDVPDFPQPGILFKDITPLLGDPSLFAAVTRDLAARFERDAVTHVVAIESRGFLFGAPIAQHLGAALVPVRKPGKLPSATIRQRYALEYGEDSLEIHVDACSSPAGDHRIARVLIVDDVLATGGTAAAAAALVRQLAAQLAGCAFVREIAVLGGRSRLTDAGRTETLLAV